MVSVMARPRLFLSVISFHTLITGPSLIHITDEPQASHHFWELLGGEVCIVCLLQPSLTIDIIQGPIHTAEEGNKSSSTGVTGEKKLFRCANYTGTTPIFMFNTEQVERS